MRWLTHQRIGQLVSLSIAGRKGNRHWRIFTTANKLTIGHWRIVDRGDGNGNGGRVAIRTTIVSLESQTIRAAVIGMRCVSQIGCRSIQRAMRWLTHQRIG